MPAPLIHLLLTRRGPLWRVRILSGGVIRWKSYRAADYPTPEAVAQRCVAGLAKDHPSDKTHEGKKGDHYDCISHFHDSPLHVRWEYWGLLTCKHGISMPAGDGPTRPLLEKADWC